MDKRSVVGLSSRDRIMGVWEQNPVLQAFYNGKAVEFLMRIDQCPETAVNHSRRCQRALRWTVQKDFEIQNQYVGYLEIFTKKA